MTGTRLWVGLVTMGVIVPAVVVYFLEAISVRGWITVAIPCFVGWCIAEFVANVLTRPRLRDRTPSAAIKEWEETRTPE